MDDYESPAAMAEHLNYLMDHPEEYMSYFAWRLQGLTRVKNPRNWIGASAPSKAAAKTATAVIVKSERKLKPKISLKYLKTGIF